MSEDDYGTRVIFKQDKGEVMAFLLDVPSNYGRVACYAHIGQHGEADINYARSCKPASPDEYAVLKQELESLGYVLTIRRKFPSGFVQGDDGVPTGADPDGTVDLGLPWGDTNDDDYEED